MTDPVSKTVPEAGEADAAHEDRKPAGEEVSTGAFLRALEARRHGLEAFESSWRLVEDVLDGRLKHRTADGWRSSYLPQGKLEADREYALRVEMTPFFPETPRVLTSRLGALFRHRLRPDGGAAPAWARFLDEAGRRHVKFEDLAVQAAALAQTHGFCAALLDRDPLPADVRDRTPSAAEAAARRMGRPYLTVYAAPDILDWGYGSDGLPAWVKFREFEQRRARWDAPAETVRVYRLVDREAIHVYRVSRDAEGRPRVAAEAPVPHGFSRVPVVFLHPFPGRDGVGRSLLARAAEADVAAARILSDLVWDLFLLGNPILTLKTSRSERDLSRLGLGASRYIPLRNGRPGVENAEELSFVQLDPTGIDALFRAHGLFAAQAARQAGRAAEAAAALPRQQSGLARAWEFKTGEERVLFLLARALEPFLSSCLALAAEALGLDERPVMRLPETFDVSGPQETAELTERILKVAREAGLNELGRTALARLEDLLGVLPEETRAALRREREAISFAAPNQTAAE